MEELGVEMSQSALDPTATSKAEMKDDSEEHQDDDDVIHAHRDRTGHAFDGFSWQDDEKEHEGHDDEHGHGGGIGSIVDSVISGGINGALM